MKKTAYYCDICHDETPRDQILGCRFSNMKEFTLTRAEGTDGTHICVRCAKQLQAQLNMTGLLPRDEPERPYDAAAHAATYP